MFDKLLAALEKFGERLSFLIILKEWEEGVLLRFGKFKKILTKGVSFKYPFIDTYISHHVVATTYSLPAQSLITTDKQNIVVKGLIKFRIFDIKAFLLDVWNHQDAIADITEGIIKNIIMSKTFQECMDIEIDNTITKKVRSEVKKYGVEIIQVTLTDIASIRSYRIMNDSHFNKAEE